MTELQSFSLGLDNAQTILEGASGLLESVTEAARAKGYAVADGTVTSFEIVRDEPVKVAADLTLIPRDEGFAAVRVTVDFPEADRNTPPWTQAVISNA